MAKITLLLRTRHKGKDEAYPIIIKVRSGNQVKEIPIGFKVKESQWNGTVIKHPDKERINARIADKMGEVNRFISDCILNNKRINLAELGGPRTSIYFTDYIESRAKSYDATDQGGQAGRLRFIIKELDQFGKLPFSAFNAEILRKYHAYLLTDHGANTIHKRFSTLKQLFANAVSEGVYIGANPFAQFKVKREPVRKEKLTVKEITQIEKAKVKGAVLLAKDLFLFSYYCKGIRFENCVLLHSDDIRQGRVFIRTNKGNKHISVQIHAKLKSILDRYQGNGFVFGMVNKMPENQTEKRKLLDPLNIVVNRNLKILAAAAGIEKNVSHHIARHSLAFHLKQKGVDIGAIKDVLSHSDTQTTEMYLAALDDEFLDSEMDKVYGTVARK